MAMLRLKRFLLRAVDVLGAGLVHGFFLLARVVPYRWMAAFGGGFARLVGPRLRASRTARANLALAFPGKTEAEREAILQIGRAHV